MHAARTFLSFPLLSCTEMYCTVLPYHILSYLAVPYPVLSLLLRAFISVYASSAQELSVTYLWSWLLREIEMTIMKTLCMVMTYRHCLYHESWWWMNYEWIMYYMLMTVSTAVTVTVCTIPYHTYHHNNSHDELELSTLRHNCTTLISITHDSNDEWLIDYNRQLKASRQLEDRQLTDQKNKNMPSLGRNKNFQQGALRWTLLDFLVEVIDFVNYVPTADTIWIMNRSVTLWNSCMKSKHFTEEDD